MARDITSDLRDAVTAQQVTPVLLFYADFPSAAVRCWSGYGDLVWGGNTYAGVGDFGGVSAIAETSDQSANGISFTLSGIPSALLVTALSEAYQGRTCSLWLAVLKSDGTLVADPYLFFSGRMDVMSISDTGETGTITLTGENRLIDLNRARARRYTDEDQKIDYPDDKGLSYVAGLQDKDIFWGSSTSTSMEGKAAVPSPGSLIWGR